MTLDRGRAAVGVILVAVAALAIAGRGALAALVLGPGAPVAQRPLAGAPPGPGDAAPSSRALRVVVLDGLGRADAARVPAFAAVCARGLDAVVDVGFPTKSLPVQRVLWTGLTAQQTGARGDNAPTAPPAGAVPARVGGVAVVESHGHIARSVGFDVIVAGDDLPARAAAVAAGDARLVMIHVLAIDVAAHRGGPRGARWEAALVRADAVLAAALAAAPDAAWLVLSDHGHVEGGGHGDVEDEVRRVRACWSPAPIVVDPASPEPSRRAHAARRGAPAGTGPSGAELHLIDVARWIADALGVPLDRRAAGRPLDVALAYPDRDATLPRASSARWAAAFAALLLGAIASARAARPRWIAGWPVITVGVVLAIHGLPTLSARAPLGVLLVAAALPALAAWWLERHRPALRVAIGCLATVTGSAVALAILSGVPHALVGGPPARVPYATGALGAAAHVVVTAFATIGLAMLVQAFTPAGGPAGRAGRRRGERAGAHPIAR